MENEDFLVVQAEYAPKLRTMARSKTKNLPGYDEDDVYQELLVVLWRCLSAYDPDNGCRFRAFFWRAAQNRITDLMRRAITPKRQSEFFVLPTKAVETLDEDAFAIICDQYCREISAEDWAELRLRVRFWWNKLTVEQRRELVLQQTA